MHPKYTIRWFVLLTLLAGLLFPAALPLAPRPSIVRAQSVVTPYDLIVAMNTVRASNGLPLLIEDPIIDAVAQSTAETMAANEMSWHVGNVSGRLQSAGYGGGAKVWATENFAAGSNYTIDQVMLVWSDESHLIPAAKAAYCNIGAGVAVAPNGLTYYVLQAAYTSSKACGAYTSPKGSGPTNQQGGSTDQGRVGGVSQLIVPVKIAAPDKDGKIWHVVQQGQSFWSIAVAYKITIKDLEIWNNLSSDSKLQIGQKLFIPGLNTKGYATPTPIGMFATAAPDRDGKIIHTVSAYQTLTTISQAYGVKIDTILSLNRIQASWPLQIGQKLVINPGRITPSPTPRPLTPIEKLTPAADGKYYHAVRSGENLSSIAALYKIPVNDLMAWNGLNSESILRINQKLLLQVTVPATQTPTPKPVTATPKPTATLPSPTLSITAVQPTPGPTVPVEKASVLPVDPLLLIIIGLAASGITLIVVFSRKR